MVDDLAVIRRQKGFGRTIEVVHSSTSTMAYISGGEMCCANNVSALRPICIV